MHYIMCIILEICWIISTICLSIWLTGTEEYLMEELGEITIHQERLEKIGWMMKIEDFMRKKFIIILLYSLERFFYYSYFSYFSSEWWNFFTCSLIKRSNLLEWLQFLFLKKKKPQKVMVLWEELTISLIKEHFIQFGCFSLLKLLFLLFTISKEKVGTCIWLCSVGHWLLQLFTL